MKEEYDYVIVGAGSTGAAISYYLSFKSKSILLVDRVGIGGGNTGRSSALIRTHYSNKLIAEMAKFSYGVISNFTEIGYSGFRANGMYFPFDARNMDAARENVKMLRGLGLTEEEVNPSELTKHFSGIVLDNFDYVIFEPRSGYAEPVSVTTSFVQKATERGAEFLPGKAVERLETNGHGVTLEFSDSTPVKASKVILATNVWTNRIISNSGISGKRLLPITASMHSVIYVRRPEKYYGDLPVLWDPPNLAYYKNEGQTMTAIGSLDPEIDKTPVDADSSLPESADLSYIEDYLTRFTNRIPGMGDAQMVNSITGMYDMTPDGQAIISQLDDIGLENVYVCAGLSGHGFKLSPAYGLITSEMVSGVEPERALFDWRIFSHNRFASGKFITSRYESIGTIY